MSAANWLQLAALVGLVLISTPLLGAYLARVFGGESAPGDRIFLPVERAFYRLFGVDSSREQAWSVYAFSLLAFSAVSVIGLYALQRIQGHLPLDPTDAVGVPPALAFNTAVSFVTNTNWQNYGGESTMSHLTQMAGLTVQNFVSAAVGIVRRDRARARPRAARVGDDRELLGRPDPLGHARSPARSRSSSRSRWPGSASIQTLDGPAQATTVEGATQEIYRGPIASQEAIKELGTNGGGPMNANSAHPFENPNGLTNLLQMWAILIIPFALTFAFGRLAKDRRQGWAVFAAMFILWIGAAFAAMALRGAGATRRSTPRAGTWRARRSGSARPRPASSPRRPPARRPER